MSVHICTTTQISKTNARFRIFLLLLVLQPLYPISHLVKPGFPRKGTLCTTYGQDCKVKPLGTMCTIDHEESAKSVSLVYPVILLALERTEFI